MTVPYARIDGGTVVEIITIPDDADIADRYHPDIVVDLILCGPEVAPGWVYGGDTFAPPPPAPPPSAADLYVAAVDKRWRVETGGISVGGVPVATDRESQSLITGAHAYVLTNPDVSIKFKAANGFVDLDATRVTAVATAVAAHVQACFAVEADVAAAIADGTVTTTQQVDDWPWPGTPA